MRKITLFSKTKIYALYNYDSIELNATILWNVNSAQLSACLANAIHCLFQRYTSTE